MPILTPNVHVEKVQNVKMFKNLYKFRGELSLVHFIYLYIEF